MSRLSVDQLLVGRRDAAEAITCANQGTVREPIPLADAYDVVSHLDDLAHRLPPVVTYLVRTAERAHAEENFDDRGTDAAAAADAAPCALRAVLDGLQPVGTHVVTAHSHLGRSPTPPARHRAPSPTSWVTPRSA